MSPAVSRNGVYQREGPARRRPDVSVYVLWQMSMGVVSAARLGLVREPTVGPDLGGAEHLATGPQDDSDRLVVVEDEGQAGHEEAVARCKLYVVRATSLPRGLSYNVPSYNGLRR